MQAKDTRKAIRKNKPKARNKIPFSAGSPEANVDEWKIHAYVYFIKHDLTVQRVQMSTSRSPGDILKKPTNAFRQAQRDIFLSLGSCSRIPSILRQAEKFRFVPETATNLLARLPKKSRGKGSTNRTNNAKRKEKKGESFILIRDVSLRMSSREKENKLDRPLGGEGRGCREGVHCRARHLGREETPSEGKVHLRRMVFKFTGPLERSFFLSGRPERGMLDGGSGEVGGRRERRDKKRERNGRGMGEAPRRNEGRRKRGWFP